MASRSKLHSLHVSFPGSPFKITCFLIVPIHLNNFFSRYCRISNSWIHTLKMDLVGTKVLALILMFVIVMFTGLLPIQMRTFVVKRWKDQSQKAVSALLCFGAGILLATVFLHMLPDILGDTDEAIENGYFIVEGYPLGELLLCTGFFVMYAIEEFVHSWVHRNQGHVDGGGDPHVVLPQGQTRKTSHVSNGDVHSDMQRSVNGAGNVAVTVGHDNPGFTKDGGEIHNNLEKAEKNDFKPVEEDPDRQISLLRTVLMILALSIHGCLEGLALGLAESNTDVWLMFTALTVHKIALSFSIAMELQEKMVSLKFHLLYMGIFSIASPIGGSIGALLLEYSDSSTKAGSLTIIFLNSLSGGTIMFVVFCEILERERSKYYGRFTRLVSLALGFLFMAALQLLEAEEGESEPPATTDIISSSTAMPAIRIASLYQKHIRN